MNRKETFSFSQPKSFSFFFSHINTFFYMVIAVLFLFTYQDLKGDLLYDVIILAGVLSLILALFGKFIAKLIWRLDVDFNKEKIIFYLCRKNDPIHVDFHEIQRIKVNGPIVFFLKRKKLLYSTNQYQEILPVLHKIKRIQWGGMCDSLGPDKSIRDLIDNSTFGD